MTKDELNQRYDPMNRAELIAECERLREKLRRLAQEVVDEDRRTVGPEGPSWQLLDLAEKALASSPSEPEKPK